MLYQTETPLPPVDLYEKFSAAAQAHPTRSALIFAGSRTDYQTLERQAAQVAAALENALDGQKREKEPPLAAVLLPRTPQLYAAMLGAMRAGVPYLLLSCDLPAGRIRQILSQSGAQAVLSTPQILARLGVDPAPIALRGYGKPAGKPGAGAGRAAGCLGICRLHFRQHRRAKRGGDQPLEPFEPVAGHAGSIRRRRGAFGVQRGV